MNVKEVRSTETTIVPETRRRIEDSNGFVESWEEESSLIKGDPNGGESDRGEVGCGEFNSEDDDDDEDEDKGEVFFSSLTMIQSKEPSSEDRIAEFVELEAFKGELKLF